MTRDSRQENPWSIGQSVNRSIAGCVCAVVWKGGGGASEDAGRGGGCLAVDSQGRATGLSCVRGGEQDEVKVRDTRGALQQASMAPATMHSQQRQQQTTGAARASWRHAGGCKVFAAGEVVRYVW